MQKAEAQHNQAQNQPVQRLGAGASLESPQGEQIAQLEAMAEASPHAGKLAQLAAMASGSQQSVAQHRMMDMIHNSPYIAAQRKLVESTHNSLYITAQRQRLNSLAGETAQSKEKEGPLQPKITQREQAPAKPNNTGLPDNLKNGIESLSGMSMNNAGVHYNSSQPVQLNAPAFGQVRPALQMKTKIVEERNDAADGETKTKKIEAASTGDVGWYRFAINGNVIESFSNNLYAGEGAGGSQVQGNVEIGEQAENEGKDKNELGGKSRAVHFGLGDRKAGIDSGYRKGKWTWHHQPGQYWMELVDMHVHGAFGHHGGYAGWKDDVSDDDNY